MEDLESLQEIAENDPARRLFLLMALLSREGAVVELAHDPMFLAAVEEYLRSTQRVH